MPRVAKAAKNDRKVHECVAFSTGGWLPFTGALAAARRLERRGLIKECGIAAMPPHVLFVLTDAGREALAAQTTE